LPNGSRTPAAACFHCSFVTAALNSFAACSHDASELPASTSFNQDSAAVWAASSGLSAAAPDRPARTAPAVSKPARVRILIALPLRAGDGSAAIHRGLVVRPRARAAGECYKAVAVLMIARNPTGHEAGPEAETMTPRGGGADRYAMAHVRCDQRGAAWPR